MTYTKEEIKNYLQGYPGLDSDEIEEIAEHLTSSFIVRDLNTN